MIQKILFLLLILLSTSILVYAQPQPCGPNPGMTSFCDEACIICDINGFTGINDDPVVGQAPPGFCTSTAHHMQWIGFIAGSTNLTLKVSVFNCQQGGNNNGLEVGIYRSLDCQNFQLVSNCDGAIPNNTSQNFTNTVPLIIGQYYFFVMDGNGDDVCNYTITVLNGTTAVNQLPNSGVLTGDPMVCLGDTIDYTLDAPSGAAWFAWKLDNVPLTSGIDTTVSVIWNTPGTHTLCATASNVCDTAAPVCRIIKVKAIPNTEIDVTLCEGECWTGADTTLCNTGTYTFVYDSYEGCDSTLVVNVQVLPTQSSNLNLWICSTDTVYIDDHPYFETGIYSDTLTNLFGCDSIINLDLLVIQCEIEGELSPNHVNCNGFSDAALRFSVFNGTPPFNYQWKRIGSNQPSGTGMVNALNIEQTISGLPVGTYFITVTDNFGNDVILFTDISEPPALDALSESSDFNGQNISCPGLTDGSIQLAPTGGTPPYGFLWSNGSSTQNLENQSAGTYTITMTDAQSCTWTTSLLLTEAAPLDFEADFQNPGCEGANTGLIQATQITGGTPPFQIDFDNQGFGSDTVFVDVAPGNHSLVVRDTNGCLTSKSGTLTAPIIPDIELGPNLEIDLGTSIRIDWTQNITHESFVWTPSTGLSCTDCAEPDAKPYFSTTYWLEVTAPGGCTDVDSIRILVTNKRQVYIPNIFSPDDNGKNDWFTVYAGPEVMQVRSLSVWSRWGELIFSKQNFQPNLDNLGWDGYFKGKPVSTGVYTWTAEIEFLDGERIQSQGSVTVLR